MPTTIAQLETNVFEDQNLDKIADFTCRDKSEIHFLPFEITKEDVEVIANFENKKSNIINLFIKTHFEKFSDLNIEFFESAKMSLLDPLGIDMK